MTVRLLPLSQMSCSGLEEDDFRRCCRLLLQRSEQLRDGWSWEAVQGSEEGYLRKTALRPAGVAPTRDRSGSGSDSVTPASSQSQEEEEKEEEEEEEEEEKEKKEKKEEEEVKHETRQHLSKQQALTSDL
ncbi:hypothetical protein EYF80_049960 [Liparis tanakae]|uniref:Uncharacterized protein n=1 Tax=Liparis tanakae TaxID=230148 RepID=A0A4Z2FG49_9TELE|nr:hypothetical protein EYF80_049960 [Liparis tanakae]